ncbi:DUF3108 domain-containing protein [Prosthecomicrobium sp. N25]|uniref:DUF3108 domain-containing protein n=1 Tax=Prosthecomicrobium sp. N25 TaxID=3129254 RepID=UPI003077371C
MPAYRVSLCRMAGLAVVGALATLPGPAAAGDGQISASYDITIGGIALAKGNLVVKVDKDAYTARVGYRTTGVAKVVSRATGEAMATGAIKGDKPAAATYQLDTNGERRPAHVVMGLANGTIKSLDQNPPLKDDPERVPVEAQHRQGVVDPLSAILMPLPRKGDAALGPAACDRTLPVFDGWTRYDVKLSFKAAGPIQKAGYAGPSITCAARWVPVAGHKPEKDSTKFMVDNKDIEVTLVPAADTGVLVPVRVAVMTLTGLLVVDADRFTVIGNEAQAIR